MHTKGEWIWYNGCSWWRLGTKDGAGTRDTLIVCPTIDSDGHPNLNVSEEDKQLISASPDMYEALKEYKKYTGGENFKLGETINIQHIEILMRLSEIAKQAIKKAEG